MDIIDHALEYGLDTAIGIQLHPYDTYIGKYKVVSMEDGSFFLYFNMNVSGSYNPIYNINIPEYKVYKSDEVSIYNKIIFNVMFNTNNYIDVKLYNCGLKQFAERTILDENSIIMFG